MHNAVLVTYDGKPFTVVLIHNPESLTVSQVVDQYSDFGGFDRACLSGYPINVVDITNCKDGFAEKPVANGEW